MVKVRCCRFVGQHQQPQGERDVDLRLDLKADPFGAREDVVRADPALKVEQISGSTSNRHVEQTMTVQMAQFAPFAMHELNSAEPMDFQQHAGYRERLR